MNLHQCRHCLDSHHCFSTLIKHHNAKNLACFNFYHHVVPLTSPDVSIISLIAAIIDI